MPDIPLILAASACLLFSSSVRFAETLCLSSPRSAIIRVDSLQVVHARQENVESILALVVRVREQEADAVLTIGVPDVGDRYIRCNTVHKRPDRLCTLMMSIRSQSRFRSLVPGHCCGGVHVLIKYIVDVFWVAHLYHRRLHIVQIKDDLIDATVAVLHI
jgi:hypothetical protein